MLLLTSTALESSKKKDNFAQHRPSSLVVDNFSGELAMIELEIDVGGESRLLMRTRNRNCKLTLAKSTQSYIEKVCL